MLSSNYRGRAGGGCAAGRPVDLHVSAVAGNFSNDSHACRLSLGFPEIQGLFQTLMSVCDMSDSVCTLLWGCEASLLSVRGALNSDACRHSEATAGEGQCLRMKGSPGM